MTMMYARIDGVPGECRNPGREDCLPVLNYTCGHFDLSVHNILEHASMTQLKGLLRRRLEGLTGRQPIGSQ